MDPDLREFSDPKRAMAMGVGLASPLWPTFFLAAGAGVAFWAWSRWARPFPLGGIDAAPTPLSESRAFADPVAAVETALEPAYVIDPVTEAFIEDTLDGTAERDVAAALAEEALPPEPEPAVEAAAEAAPEVVVEPAEAAEAVAEAAAGEPARPGGRRKRSRKA